jgi:rubrerythrin
MSTVFHADEVLQMAAQIELNGGLFYRRAAEICEEGKELLLLIAEQEDEHLALFEGMRKDFAARESEVAAFDPDNEAALYLEAMADSHVFDLTGTDLTELLKGKETLDDILDIALQAEKDTISFFVAMRELVPADFGRDKVDALMLEETKHIHWILEEKKKIKEEL